MTLHESSIILSSDYYSASTDNYDHERLFSSHYKLQKELLANLNSTKLPNSYRGPSRKVRKDKLGKEISKKGKVHKVTFADQIEKPGREFVQVKNVESIKEFYNITRVDVEGKQCFGCLII